MDSEKTKISAVAVISTVTVLVLVVVVFSVGIYRFGWDNPVTNIFVRIVPLPAAIVDGKMVSIGLLDDHVRAFQSAVSFQTEFDFGSQSGEETLDLQKEQILGSLIENELVRALAKERRVVVFPDQLESYFDFLLPQFGIGSAEAAGQIESVFGWSEREFKKNIVEPDLLRAQLLIALLDDSRDSSAYTQIEFIKQELGRGVSFASLANDLSDDEDSKFIDGELGFFAREDLPPWFQDEVFSLAEGRFSDIIVSPDGYHIFQAVFRDEQADPPEVQLRHILIADDPLTKLVERKRELAKIYISR